MVTQSKSIRWEADGAEAVLHDGRLSIMAKPSMTADDGTVAVGIDAPGLCPVSPTDLAKALEEIDWYRRLLECAFEGKPVRNLDEAQLGYERALNFLRGAP